MAESTPVSSVMRASTWTCPPFRLARTSEICGGLVSSARAGTATNTVAITATVEMRMCRHYRTCRSGGISIKSRVHDAVGTQASDRSIQECVESRYAAAVAACGESLTETVFEMPGSSMVTP